MPCIFTMHGFSVNCQSIQMRTYGYESTSTICPKQAEIEREKINIAMSVLAEYDFAVKNIHNENNSKTNNYLLSLKMQIITNLQWFIVKQSISSDSKLWRMILVLLPEIKSFQPYKFQIWEEIYMNLTKTLMLSCKPEVFLKEWFLSVMLIFGCTVIVDKYVLL